MPRQDERLIAAMTELVSEVGYRRASIAKVIERAGVSRKTFYELFEDRGACFAAAHKEAVREIDAATKRDDGLAAVVDLYGRRPEVFDLVFAAAAVAGPHETQTHLEARERWASWLEALASQAEEGSAPFGESYPPEIARMAFGSLITALCRSATEADGVALKPDEAVRLALLPWLGPKLAGRYSGKLRG